MGKLFNYAVTLGVAILVAYSIVATQRPLPRVKQIEFNKWYEEVAQDFSSMPLEKVPEVVISLEGPSEGSGLFWRLSTETKEEKRVDQVERLLEFIRTSEVFGLSSENERSKMTLTVQGRKRRFETQLGMKQIEKDIRLQNFITLFQVFSPEQTLPKKELS